MAENKRLLHEIKCLFELKTHLIIIHSKYETLIDCEDKQDFRLLSLRLDQLSDKQTDQTIGSQKCGQKRGRKRIKTSQKVIKRENNDLTDKVVINEDSDERKPIIDSDMVSTKAKTSGAKRLKSKLRPKFGYKPKTSKTYRRCDYEGCDYRCLSEQQLSYHKITHDTSGQSEPAVRYVERRKDLYRRCYDLTTDCFVCDICDPMPDQKSYKTFHSLRVHMNYVHTSRNVVCDYADCGKLFKSLGTMRSHYRCVHSDDKPFKCPHNDCRQQYISQSQLDIHLSVHTTERQFPCGVGDCPKAYKTLGALQNHQRVHNREPTIKCTVEGCPQRFHKYGRLNKHRETEHGWPRRVRLPLPLINCQWPGCDFTTKRNTCLKLHQNTHTGERPYVCDWPECGKGFARPDGLKDHKNIHNNVKPYGCHWPGCQYRSGNTGNAYKHYKQVHLKLP
ncbi:unnamed protein product [Medioppia subpectinata]|uniref:C2H2-type domain-containing protein n=1 Tax=Medioppia subpectinata TaxID=1979941 RepID=A0A7R9Q8G8_9ACAR|nr:unnamed protein product [Medioppia subpectinata]CAG2116622.1 unnamed protein product [Medioppia subpectinata]